MEFNDECQDFHMWDVPDVNCDEFIDPDVWANHPDTGLLAPSYEGFEGTNQSVCTDDWTLFSGHSTNPSLYSPLTVSDTQPESHCMIHSPSIDPNLLAAVALPFPDKPTSRHSGSAQGDTFSVYTSSASPQSATINQQTYHTSNMTTDPQNSPKSQRKKPGRKKMKPEDLMKNRVKIEKPHRCLICVNTGFARDRDLRRHMAAKHKVEAEEDGIDTSRIKCPRCDVTIQRIRSDRMDKHMRDIHGIDPKS